MTFPNFSEIISQFNIFLLSGPIALSISIVLWVHLIRVYRRHETPDIRKEIFAAVVCTIIGLGHFLGIYPNVLYALQFRNLDLHKVSALKIERLKTEGSYPEPASVVIEDGALVREGMEKLTSARSRLRNHESFSDGYRIQLIMNNTGSNHYLTFFRRSSNSGEADVVIPHLFSNGMLNGGEYSCTECFEWIRLRVDPLFVSR